MGFDRITSRLSDVMSKMSGVPGLSGLTLPSAFSANGGIPIVYKGIVVTVMAIVASGTLVTFGTAGAEEVPLARSGAQIPAASEANPVVEGQPLPLGLDPSLFASSPLLSTIDLTDASAADFSSLDDDDDSADNNKHKNKHKNNKHKKAVTKKAVVKKPAAKKRSGDQSRKQAATSNPAPSPKQTEKPSDKPAEQQTTQPPPAPAPTPTEQTPTTRECVKKEPLTRLCLKWSS